MTGYQAVSETKAPSLLTWTMKSPKGSAIILSLLMTLIGIVGLWKEWDLGVLVVTHNFPDWRFPGSKTVATAHSALLSTGVMLVLNAVLGIVGVYVSCSGRATLLSCFWYVLLFMIILDCAGLVLFIYLDWFSEFPQLSKCDDAKNTTGTKNTTSNGTKHAVEDCEVFAGTTDVNFILSRVWFCFFHLWFLCVIRSYHQMAADRTKQRGAPDPADAITENEEYLMMLGGVTPKELKAQLTEEASKEPGVEASSPSPGDADPMKTGRFTSSSPTASASLASPTASASLGSAKRGKKMKTVVSPLKN